MAVARLDPVYVRRFDPSTRRAAPVERRFRAPRRALMVGLIVAGGAMQHVLATTPLEPQPAPLALAAGGTAPMAVAAAAPYPHAAIAGGAAHATLRFNALPARPPRAAVLRPGHMPAPALTASHPAAGTVVVLPPVGVFGDAHRVAMAPNPLGLIQHVPSVSVAAIRAALSAAGSPVLSERYADHKDAAEYIWDSGRYLGIDPAVLMAMFRYESMFGTRGVAQLTDSVGNIRPLPGQPSLDGYRLYSSWEEGIDDCYRLLQTYARGGAGSIPLAIPTWAPASDDNDPGAYASGVLGIMSQLYAASTQ